MYSVFYLRPLFGSLFSLFPSCLLSFCELFMRVILICYFVWGPFGRRGIACGLKTRGRSGCWDLLVNLGTCSVWGFPVVIS